jgi:hypothetical protein
MEVCAVLPNQNLLWQGKVVRKHYRDLFNLEMKEHDHGEGFFY